MLRSKWLPLLTVSALLTLSTTANAENLDIQAKGSKVPMHDDDIEIRIPNTILNPRPEPWRDPSYYLRDDRDLQTQNDLIPSEPVLEEETGGMCQSDLHGDAPIKQAGGSALQIANATPTTMCY